MNAIGVPFAVFVSTRHIAEGLRFPTYYLRAAIRHTTRNKVEIQGASLDISSDQAKRAAINEISKALKTLPLQQVDNIVESLTDLLPDDQWK